jgi:hypothetical protein
MINLFKHQHAALLTLLGLSILIPSLLAGCPDGTTLASGSGSDVIVTTRGLTDVIDPQEGTEPIVAVRGLTDVDVAISVPDQPRHFLVGAVAIGFESNDYIFEDIAKSIERNNHITDTIIVRPLVDWEFFRPNGTGFAITTTEVEQIVNHAKVSNIPYSVIEMDPLLDRHTVSPLPPALDGQDFSDSDIQTAHRSMALELVRELQPTYISFAVEVNAYADSNYEDFLNLVAHHKALYYEVKAISPNTKVIASMNYEALTGLLGLLDERLGTEPRWDLVELFQPELDALALSTLPWPVFGKPRNMPDDYLRQIQDNIDLPYLITECGWTTAEIASSNEHDQAEYVSQISRMALDSPNLKLLAWSISSDPPPGSIFQAFPAFQQLGLTRNSGVDRPAYFVWQDLFELPYVPNNLP